MADKADADVRATVQLHITDEASPQADPPVRGRDTRDSVVEMTSLKNTYVHVDELFHGDDPDEEHLRKRARQFDQDGNGLLDMVRVLKIAVAIIVLGLLASIGAIAGLTFTIVASNKEVSVANGSALTLSAHGRDPLRTATASGSVFGTGGTTTNTTSRGRRRLLDAADESSCMYNGSCPVSYASCQQVSSWLDMLQQETREVDIMLNLTTADAATCAAGNNIKARALKYIKWDAPMIQAVNVFPPDPAAPDEYTIKCASGALAMAAEADCQCPIYLMGQLLANPAQAQGLLVNATAPMRRLLGAAPATAPELPLGSHTLLPAVSVPCSAAQQLLQHHHVNNHARMLLPDPFLGHVLPVSMRMASSAYTLDPTTGANTSLLHMRLSILPLGIPKLPDIYIGCPAEHVPHHYGTLQHAAAPASAPSSAADSAPSDGTCSCHVYLRAAAGLDDREGTNAEPGAVSLTPGLLAAVLGASGNGGEGVLAGGSRRRLLSACNTCAEAAVMRAYANMTACQAGLSGANYQPTCGYTIDLGSICNNRCECVANGTVVQLLRHEGFWDNSAPSPYANQCFPAGAPVLLADGSSKAVEELVPGDMMAVATADGSIGAAPFAFYSHKDAHAHAHFVAVVTDGGRVLHLTDGHYLPASLTPDFADSTLVTPSQLTLDNFVFVARTTTPKLHAEKVAWVSVEHMTGLYAPHAASKGATLIVGDGIVASEFTTALPLPVAKVVRSFFLAVNAVFEFCSAKWAYYLVHDVAFHGFMSHPAAVRATLQAVWRSWAAIDGGMASLLTA